MTWYTHRLGTLANFLLSMTWQIALQTHCQCKTSRKETWVCTGSQWRGTGDLGSETNFIRKRQRPWNWNVCASFATAANDASACTGAAFLNLLHLTNVPPQSCAHIHKHCLSLFCSVVLYFAFLCSVLVSFCVVLDLIPRRGVASSLLMSVSLNAKSSDAPWSL